MVRQRVSLSSLSGWLLSSFLLSLHIWRVAEPLSPLDLQTLQRQNCILRPNWLIFDDLGGGFLNQSSNSLPLTLQECQDPPCPVLLCRDVISSFSFICVGERKLT